MEYDETELPPAPGAGSPPEPPVELMGHLPGHYGWWMLIPALLGIVLWVVALVVIARRLAGAGWLQFAWTVFITAVPLLGPVAALAVIREEAPGSPPIGA